MKGPEYLHFMAVNKKNKVIGLKLLVTVGVWYGKTQYLPIQLSRKNAVTLTTQKLKSVVLEKNTTFLAHSTSHLAVLLIWSPSGVSLSLSHTHIGLP